MSDPNIGSSEEVVAFH